MIKLSAAAAWTPSNQLLLAPTTESFRNGEHIGILAAPGSGKTTLARIIAGSAAPNSGRVLRDGPQTTILGQENLLHPHMQIGPALEMAAIYLGLKARDPAAKCLKFATPGLEPWARVSTLSPVQKSCLAFALSVQQPGQWIIADDRLVPSDPQFAAKAEVALRMRLRRSGLIFISKNATQLGRFCTRLFVLARASLIAVPDVAMALAVLRTSEEQG